MSKDMTDRTDPISEVNNRLVPPQRVRQAKTVGAEVRINQARRSFASLAAAAVDPPLQQRHEFVLSDFGKLKTHSLSGFHLANNDSPEAIGFTLTFTYRGRDRFRHMCESELVHKKLRHTLVKYGLNFREVTSATINRIEADSAVPAFISLSAAPDGKFAVLTLSNVMVLGTATYEVPIEALDRHVIASLVELISSGNRDFYGVIAKTGARRD